MLRLASKIVLAGSGFSGSESSPLEREQVPDPAFILEAGHETNQTDTGHVCRRVPRLARRRSDNPHPSVIWRVASGNPER